MNGIIAISVVFVFVIAFISLFILSSIFPVNEPVMDNHSFFDSTFESEKHVFLFGHSMTAQLNVTKINNIITDEYDNTLVYNLAYNGDNPNKRILHLEKISNLNPTYVFYGITYTDFSTNIKESEKQDTKILPDPRIAFEQFIEKNNQEYGPFNPKITILKAIRSTLDFTGLFPPTTANKIYLENAPFSYFAEYQRLIHTDSANLERYTSVEEIQNIKILYSEENLKIQNFKEIIRKLQQQDTSVVIFLPPLHSTYLSNIQPDINKKFEKIISDVKQEFNVTIYDFRDRYVDLPIWMDVTHIAYHPDSMIYSQEIADMILSELP